MKHKEKRKDIVDILKEEITGGGLSPGQRLVEAQLNERFGFTSYKIRQALRQLEAEGFVKVIPNVGAMVSELSQKDIEHSYDLMAVLEGLSVREATPFITANHLQELELVVDRMETVDDPLLFYRLNDEFHSLIASLSENERLIRFADNLRIHLRRFGSEVFYNPVQRGASRKEHRKIFEAIKEAKSEKAERLVRDHYLKTKNCHIRAACKSL
jgi:DNA-binding GntR family transcriptional regulator